MTICFIGCRMTAKDFEICRALLAALMGSGSPLVAALRQKLERTIIVQPGRLDPLSVTLNSRVEFRVDEEAPQKRILVANEFRNGLVGLTLPVSTARGLALLGLRQGQRSTFHEAGRERSLSVDRMLYQPEAAGSGHGRTPRARQEQLAPVIDFVRACEALASRSPRRSDPDLSFSRKKGTLN